MTWEEREAIFSKEAISNEDMQKLLGVSALTSTQKAYELLKAYSALEEKQPNKVQSVRKTVCYFDSKE